MPRLVGGMFFSFPSAHGVPVEIQSTMGIARTILISDDVNLFLEMEKTLFRRHDIGLLVAHTGLEALELIEREKPDLVLLDLHLEGMDGDECCRRVKENPELAGIPFVLMPRANVESIDR